MKRAGPKQPAEAGAGKARQLALVVGNQHWTSSERTPPSALKVAYVEVEGVEYAVVQLSTASFAPAELTPSESALLPGVLRGKSTRELAAERGLSERTVSNQLAAIYRKLHISGRSELLALAAASAEDDAI